MALLSQSRCTEVLVMDTNGVATEDLFGHIHLRCSKCREIRPIEDFRRRPGRPISGSRWGRWSHCKECERAIATSDEGKTKSRKRALKSIAKLRERDPSKLRRRERKENLRRLYGITPEQYDEMFAKQGGCCAICGKPPSGGRSQGKYLSVDHDHSTGAIRALLCEVCNCGIGKFRDNPGLLRRAAEYLESYA